MTVTACCTLTGKPKSFGLLSAEWDCVIEWNIYSRRMDFGLFGKSGKIRAPSDFADKRRMDFGLFRESGKKEKCSSYSLFRLLNYKIFE